MKLIMMSLMILGAMAVNPDADRVTFPEWPTYTFQSFSGLIPVAAGLRNLHYVYLESQSNPATDPVVLWLNGGPGCSSLLGLLTEIGPYVIENGDKQFTENPYPWNKKANLLFLESPAGVGFSTVSGDYTYTDDNTGADNSEAIRNFLVAFNLIDRDFWISGESYAGMYIPYTAKWILSDNKNQEKKIKLRGILIGNGLLVNDDAFREQAMIKYFNRRSFVDLVTQKQLYKQCSIAPTSVSCQLASFNFYQDCLNANISPYNVYGYCYEDTTPESLKSELNNIRFPYTSWLSWNKLGQSGAPCSDFGQVTRYLNQHATALHVTGKWQACNMKINASYQRNKNGSYLLLKDLYEAGLEILIFSGDLDAAVSVVETEESLIRIPGIVENKPWTAYGNADEILAGWITQYNYLTFVVIRGAGHMVPQDQRQNGYEMFSKFIDGTLTA